MKTKTTLKAGYKNAAGGAGAELRPNHNQTLVRETTPCGVKTQTHLKAGGKRLNHNETMVRDA